MMAFFKTAILAALVPAGTSLDAHSQEFLCDWPSATSSAELEALRSGKLLFPPEFGLGPIDHTSGIDWAAFNDEEATVRWYLNNFTFLRPLLTSENPNDTEIASRLLQSWHEANPRERPASNFAWDGHAAAIRSEYLACLAVRGVETPWLTKAVETHARFLADPDFYQGNWNHGLDQNIGLLYLGCAVGREEWVDLARERSIDAIQVMADWQGVSIEQATRYHDYNYMRFLDAEKLFADCGAPLPPEVFERLARMPEFLAHATQPDGTLIDIGDTTRGYTLLSPKSGPHPSGRFAVYHAGYAFGRSGWGSDRPFDQESFYSLRFGPGRIIHGHNDHTALTYFAKGRPILIDSGFNGYTDDKWRPHFRSPQAHSVVYATDNANFFWNARTRLTDLQIERDWQSYRLEDDPYHKTKRVRDVLFVQSPMEAIVVRDTIKGPSRPYEQAGTSIKAFH